MESDKEPLNPMSGIKKLFNTLVLAGFSETQAIEYITSLMTKIIMSNKILNNIQLKSKEKNNFISMEELLKGDTNG